jgi:hypothetical protein
MREWSPGSRRDRSRGAPRRPGVRAAALGTRVAPVALTGQRVEVRGPSARPVVGRSDRCRRLTRTPWHGPLYCIAAGASGTAGADANPQVRAWFDGGDSAMLFGHGGGYRLSRVMGVFEPIDRDLRRLDASRALALRQAPGQARRVAVVPAYDRAFRRRRLTHSERTIADIDGHADAPEKLNAHCPPSSPNVSEAPRPRRHQLDRDR